MYIIAGTTEQRQLYTTYFWQALRGYMGWAVERFEGKNNNAHKYIVFSGHDDNIVEYATAFGHVFPTYIPFASQMLFEVWQDSEGGYYVNTTVNGETLKMQDDCGNSDKCDLQAFYTLTESFEYKGDWDKWCGRSEELMQMIRSTSLESRMNMDDFTRAAVLSKQRLME